MVNLFFSTSRGPIYSLQCDGDGVEGGGGARLQAELGTGWPERKSYIGFPLINLC